MNKVQGLILLCAGLTLAAVGGSFATGYIMGQADAKVAKQPVSTIYQSGRYSVDLPEGFAGQQYYSGYTFTGGQHLHGQRNTLQLF